MIIMLYLPINDIDHSKAKAKAKAMSPQTNGICERFHKTILNEFYQITFVISFTRQLKITKKTGRMDGLLQK